MVRASFVNEVNSAIAGTGFFDVADFDITTKVGERAGDTLQIQYKYDSQFYFVAQIPKSTPSSSEYKISFTASPGQISVRESGTLHDKYDLTRSISDWLQREKEELFALPVYRELDQQKTQLRAMFERLKDVEDSYFSREEANILKSDLEKLREQIIEQIKADTANKEEQAQRIQDITNDVSALKASVDVLSKPNWVRAAAARFYRWSQDPNNRGLLKDGVEVATRLLSGNVEK